MAPPVRATVTSFMARDRWPLLYLIGTVLVLGFVVAAAPGEGAAPSALEAK